MNPLKLGETVYLYWYREFFPDRHKSDHYHFLEDAYNNCILLIENSSH